MTITINKANSETNSIYNNHALLVFEQVRVAERKRQREQRQKNKTITTTITRQQHTPSFELE
jgi:hypothetical protein